MRDRHDEAVRALAAACRRADTAALRAALDADAVAVCDSGAPAPTAPHSIHGARDVARLVAVLLCGRPGADVTVEAVNGRAGLVLRRGGRAVAVVAVGTAGAAVSRLWIVLNPAKLGGWHRR
ncbi:siderophore-interacting protein [Micromonospora costi]|uniref:Siderophore-interacting protein n=1 Tax=Micromonospora costi TaxID=1530042 RepID=A0A3A9ZVF4_9ACTN|nr:siderophore-interacting protein [Micromonospora costi]